MVQVTNRWSAPPVGGALVLRFYVRNDLPEGRVVGNPHPLHLGRAGTAGPELVRVPRAAAQLQHHARAAT